jgi:hypothetical protein
MRHGESTEAPVTRPVLFVVDADAQARAETESALARRFGSDYSVLSAASASGDDLHVE